MTIYIKLFQFQIKLAVQIILYSCNIIQCMMSTTERAVLDQQQPAGVSQDVCDQQGISIQSDDHCKEQQELWPSRQEGDILLKFVQFNVNCSNN